MNMLISNEFGQYFARLPLRKAAMIVHGDSLKINWSTLKTKDALTVYADQLNYKVVGEPTEKYGTLNVITQSATEVKSNQEFPTATLFEPSEFNISLSPFFN